MSSPASRRRSTAPLVAGLAVALLGSGSVAASATPVSTSLAAVPSGSVSLVAASAPAAVKRDATTVAAKDRVPFRLGSRDLTPAEKRAMTGVVWRKGCPVPLEHLKRVSMRYRGFDGKTYSGVLVVHRNAVPAVRVAFSRMFAAGVPIRRMQPIEAYGGSDAKSMAANNTSALNCRRSTGSATSWSRHAYGMAIDINPIENPYVTRSGRVDPIAGKAFTNRARPRPGMLTPGSAGVKAFTTAGWKWGGTWASAKDYQHFSNDGR